MRKVAGRYRVYADARGQGGDYGKARRFGSNHIEFEISSSGYKQAWNDARRHCRYGGEVEFVRGDGPKKDRLNPGMFTVYRIDAILSASPGQQSAEDGAKMLLSLPLELREALKRTASSLGIDTNSYVVSVLASSVGWTPKA